MMNADDEFVAWKGMLKLSLEEFEAGERYFGADEYPSVFAKIHGAGGSIEFRLSETMRCKAEIGVFNPLQPGPSRLVVMVRRLLQ